MTVSDHDRSGVRVSDAEREQVAAALREHLTAGRLSFEEFDERVGAAYAARTAEDLRHALRELPALVSEPPQPRRPARAGHGRRVQYALSRFVTVNGICIGVWAASGGHYFWPMWVLIPTGAATLRRAFAPDHDDERHEHRHDHSRRDDDAAADPPAQRAPAGEQPHRVLMSVLFVDIVGSTQRAAALGDAAWRRLLDAFEAAVADEVGRRDGETLFTKGDEVVAGFALPAAAVACAFGVRDRAAAIGLDVRAGVHAGEVDRRGHSADGIAMHIGRRVCEHAGAGEVLVSSTVRDLLAGSTIAFTDAGEHELKGLPGAWHLYQPVRP